MERIGLRSLRCYATMDGGEALQGADRAVFVSVMIGGVSGLLGVGLETVLIPHSCSMMGRRS